MEKFGKTLLALLLAMPFMVAAGLALGMYGQSTKEYRERHLSPDPKATIRLQEWRNEMAELRKRADRVGGQVVGLRIHESEDQIDALEKQLGVRK
jgi:bacterioferritin (cytochrome b1)